VIEKEVSLVKGEDRVQLRIESETYQTPPAFGLPASGLITEYRVKVVRISEGESKVIKSIGPESSRARIEETLAGVLKLYRADHWKAL
jgi:hypothetical protein